MSKQKSSKATPKVAKAKIPNSKIGKDALMESLLANEKGIIKEIKSPPKSKSKVLQGETPIVSQFTREGMLASKVVDVEAILKKQPNLADELLTQFEHIVTHLPKDIRLPELVPPPADVPGVEPEPIYDAAIRDDIQGNILPGFNKDHQCFLFFTIKNVAGAKKWLRLIAPLVTSMDEALSFRRMYRAKSLRLGTKFVGLSATWMNIAFSHPGMVKLVGAAEANQFGDDSFRLGLAARSSYLGDPTSSSSRGNPSRWVVGTPAVPTDIVVILASDTPAHLTALADEIKAKAASLGLRLDYEQRGETLPGALAGHEHFGFKDGISQPGVRGKASASPGDYITPRYIDHADDRAKYMAKPGQLLTWPGQYLLGEKRNATEDYLVSAPPASNFPAWAKRGSYLVVRRLNQDVRSFWGFARTAAAVLGMDPTHFASMLVGRWPSGAPLQRATAADNPALGDDPFANNHFIFDDNTRAMPLRPIPGYPGDTYPPAMADFLATVCPHFAHIRKVNTRDSMSDMGKPADNFMRMILRRGIPFGAPLIGKRPFPILKKEIIPNRGLMFLSYQASIQDQFEFLQRRWSNSPVQPNLGGHDPIIGQTNTVTGRGRFIDFPTASGTHRFEIKREWVMPTGGGYYFAPPISAITGVLGA